MPGRGVWVVGVTLTYRPGQEWSPGDISGFLARLRGDRSVGRGVVGYAWVAELQRRGAVHYHVAVVLDRGVKLRKPDQAGWWPHGMTRVQALHQSAHGYLLKYLQKGTQSGGAGVEYPKGLRAYAVVWRRAHPQGAPLAHRLRWSVLPKWLLERVVVQEGLPPVQWPMRVPGGGWWWRGAVLRSPWVPLWRPPPGPLGRSGAGASPGPSPGGPERSGGGRSP
jgi:hypothetical protein